MPGAASTKTPKKPKPKNSHGGKRAGSGRKRSDIADILERVGPMPINKPLQMVRWYTNLVGLLTEAALEGRPVKKQLEMARASNANSAKSLPPDIIFEASKRLDADDRDLKSDGPGGPAIIDRKDDRVSKRAGAIRRDPA